GGNFGAWIARVARNACLDILRSSAVRLREPDLPDDVAADLRIEDEVFSRVRAEAVAAALDTLSDDQRSAIQKAYFEGLSYREVAEQLGAPLGTVKIRRIRPWYRRTGALAGIAAALIVVAAGSWLATHRTAPSRQWAAQCGKITCGTVQASAGVLRVDARLPSLPHGKVYQAWIIHP